MKDAQETAERAKSLGATVLGEFDNRTILQDPTGVAFALSSRNSNPQAAITNEPGSFAWIELTEGSSAAKDFYTSLFDWRTETMPMPEGEYTLFKNGDRAVAGMMHKPPAPDMSARWLVNFAVTDCDASLRKAKNLGGEVMLSPTNLPGFGRVAALQDPTGAYFALAMIENTTNEDTSTS